MPSSRILVVVVMLSGVHLMMGVDSAPSSSPSGETITYNQSQNGKFNLQLSMKDVKIVAVLNSDYYDDDDNDVEYDYEDLVDSINNITRPEATERPLEIEEVEETEKPPAVVTTVPVHARPKPSKVEEVSSTEKQPVHLLSFVTDGKPENISQLPTDSYGQPPANPTVSRPSNLYSRPVRTTTARPTLQKCEPGYLRDRLNRCRRFTRRRPALFPFKFNFPGLRLSRLAQHWAQD